MEPTRDSETYNGTASSTAPQSENPSGDIFMKTKMCKFYLLGVCSKGKSCFFAHTQNELNPMPDLFRTKICRDLINTGRCDEPDCKYAHNKDELRNTSFFCRGKSGSTGAATPGRRAPAKAQQELMLNSHLLLPSQQQQWMQQYQGHLAAMVMLQPILPPGQVTMPGSPIALMPMASAPSFAAALDGNGHAHTDLPQGNAPSCRRGRRGSGRGDAAKAAGLGQGVPPGRLVQPQELMHKQQQQMRQAEQLQHRHLNKQLLQEQQHQRQLRQEERSGKQPKCRSPSTSEGEGRAADSGTTGSSSGTPPPELLYPRASGKQGVRGQDADKVEEMRCYSWLTNQTEVVVQRALDILDDGMDLDNYELPQVMPLIDLIGRGSVAVKNTFLDFEPRMQGLRTVHTAAGRLEDVCGKED